MNSNEYHLKQLTDEIRFIEQNNSSVIQYNQLKQKRDDLLNDISHTW